MSSQLARINWEAFNQIANKFSMGKALMVGEVKTLSPSEVEEINNKLDAAIRGLGQEVQRVVPGRNTHQLVRLRRAEAGGEVNTTKPVEFPRMADIVPESRAADGSIEIRHFTIDEEISIMTRLRAKLNKRPQEYIPPGRYAQLLVRRSVMMSDTKMERETNYTVVRRSRGEVLIAGLGLGMILHPILDKEDVTRVTVIEVNKGVIDAVARTLQAHIDSGRLRIIHANIFDWTPDVAAFDAIYFDIWPSISLGNLDQMFALQRKYAKRLAKGGWMDSWCKRELMARRAEAKQRSQRI